MIDVENFSYDYGSCRAVDEITFHIDKGEIAALIGPNGAGKSTTMKVLTTLLRPLHGSVCVAGYDVCKDPDKVREHLGYLPENNPLYEDMMVFDALSSIAEQRRIPAFKRLESVDEAARVCGLGDVMHRQIKALSRGYRQRVGFAQAIIHKPDVLILDEATTGLDPNQIEEIRDLIVKIGKRCTVLISTHILQEVSALAQRVIILNHGRIAADGSLDSLIEKMKQVNGKGTIEDLFRYYTLEI